ncbi:hypothetical protein [Corallincola spongiicola]|uniref:MFS transporter n=1 Tax=Corallincola spongiicola TaxID=2520508 RepID=A0ABY1WMU7_9GAMM|nr:hypothetical protein [Corallincola spongiicola]TAA43741.1 hypothetical protein EXY25_14450 [Corallincola spongiicola]
MLVLIRWVFSLLILAATALFVVDGVIRTNPTLPITVYLAVIIWGVAGASCFARNWGVGAAYAFRPFMLSIPVGLGLFAWGFWMHSQHSFDVTEVPRLANAHTQIEGDTYQLPDYEEQLKPKTYRPKLQAVPTVAKKVAAEMQLQAGDCDLDRHTQRWCRGFYFEAGKQPEQELKEFVAQQPLTELDSWPDNACPSYSVFDGQHKYGQVVNIRKGEVECGAAQMKPGQRHPVQICVQWYKYDCIVPGASAWASIGLDEAPDASVQ